MLTLDSPSTNGATRPLPARSGTARGVPRRVLDQLGRRHSKGLHEKEDERNAQGELVDGSHDGILHRP
jgi:hypothetical protein